MKKIVCYGDSNTFGFNPIDGSRYDENIRWTSLLKKKLNVNYEIINEGMCDRTGFVDNPNGFIFSGAKHFKDFILKSDNIDILILWIGTNDLQFQYNINFSEIENGLKNMLTLAQNKAEKIILIPPVILGENILKGNFNNLFDKESILKSKDVGKIYKTFADTYNCNFFDVNKFVKPSNLDGLHYSEKSHGIIADKLLFYINP